MPQDTNFARAFQQHLLLDKEIGLRVQLRRESLTILPESFASKLKISVGQLMEFEIGSAPINASLLFHMATVLRAPISSFFKPFNNTFDLSLHDRLEKPSDRVSIKEKDSFLTSPNDIIETTELIDAYLSLKDPSIRLQMRDLMKSLANDISNVMTTETRTA